MRFKILTLLIAFSVLGTFVNAQTSDSTSAPIECCSNDTIVNDTVDKGEFIIDFMFASRDVWRGVRFANNKPVVEGLMAYSYKGFEIGAFGINNFMGETTGYGNTLNIYASYTLGKWTFTLDDNYFRGDSTNIETNYFDWSNSPLLEGRISYAFNDKFQAMAGYTIAGGGFYTNPVLPDGSILKNRHGVYLEARYSITDELEVFAGGLTGANALNFQDRGGVTNVGVTFTREIQISDNFTPAISGSLVVNPNHKYTTPLYGVNPGPLHFVMMIIL